LFFLSDGCVAETTSIPPRSADGLTIDLMWPEADLGENVTLPCPCGNLSEGALNRFAYRICGGDFFTGAAWNDPVDDLCDISDVARSLCRIADVSCV